VWLTTSPHAFVVRLASGPEQIRAALVNVIGTQRPALDWPVSFPL